MSRRRGKLLVCSTFGLSSPAPSSWWAQHASLFILFWRTVQELWPTFFRYRYILHVLRGNPFICPLSLSPRARISLIVKQDKAAILTLKTLGRNVFMLSLSLQCTTHPPVMDTIFFSLQLPPCLSKWQSFPAEELGASLLHEGICFPPLCF